MVCRNFRVRAGLALESGLSLDNPFHANVGFRVKVRGKLRFRDLFHCPEHIHIPSHFLRQEPEQPFGEGWGCWLGLQGAPYGLGVRVGSEQACHRCEEACCRCEGSPSTSGHASAHIPDPPARLAPKKSPQGVIERRALLTWPLLT